jgi:hypothetical protein
MRILVFAFALLCLTAPAQAMTVEEAYKAIPHQRTIFDPEQANMARQDALYLQKFFALTDEALRDRVEALTRLSGSKGGITIAEYNKRHEKTVKALAGLAPSDTAAPASMIIVEAIGEQADFLNAWARAEPKKKEWLKANFRDDPLVQSSHNKLVKGYMMLLQAFPVEAGQNRQAFYDYLCALDFL